MTPSCLERRDVAPSGGDRPAAPRPAERRPRAREADHPEDAAGTGRRRPGRRRRAVSDLDAYLAAQRQRQALALAAHPAGVARRHAQHQGIIRHIATHYRTGADEAMAALKEFHAKGGIRFSDFKAGLDAALKEGE